LAIWCWASTSTRKSSALVYFLLKRFIVQQFVVVLVLVLVLALSALGLGLGKVANRTPATASKLHTLAIDNAFLKATAATSY
jgi:hypothetical protein